jgi:pilus assembly protein CpaB
MRRSNLIVLLLALVMGTVAALMARSWIAQHTTPSASTTNTIVVAAAPLSFGTVLTPDNLSEIPWTKPQLPEGAFQTKTDLLKDGRRVVLNAIERSEMIVKSKITEAGQRASLSVLLEEGQRAVAVRVDDVRGVAGFILPGDRVDVMLLRSESRQGEPANSAEVLLENVKVLAIDQLVNERQDQPAVATVAKAVTLQVSPEQAQKILLAGNVGKLSLVLRQAGEGRLAKTGRMTEEDLGFARAEPKPLSTTVATAAKEVLPVMTSDTAKVTIFHGLKEERYEVVRESKESGRKPL